MTTRYDVYKALDEANGAAIRIVNIIEEMQDEGVQGVESDRDEMSEIQNGISVLLRKAGQIMLREKFAVN